MGIVEVSVIGKGLYNSQGSRLRDGVNTYYLLIFLIRASW